MIFAVNASACTPSPRLAPERQDPGWPYYLGAPSHDISARESLPAEPRRVWLAEAGRAVRGALAIGPNVVAVTSTDRYLTLLERTTGKVFWRTHLGGPLAAGPLLRGDRLFVASEAAPDARAYALRLTNGKPIWTVDVKGGVAAPLLLDGGEVLLGTEPGTVWALDAESGKVHWRSKLNGAIRAQPLVTAKGVLVFTTDDSLFLLRRNDGEVLERHPTNGTVLGTPAVDSTTAYLATTAGDVVALDLTTLVPRWTVPAGDVVYGAPALARDTLFVMARSGVLLSIPIGAPEAVRRDSLLPAATAGPTPLADGVLVAGVDGTVLLARSRGPGGGEAAIAWRIQVPGPVESPPIVRDATLFVVGGHGDVHLFR